MSSKTSLYSTVHYHEDTVNEKEVSLESGKKNRHINKASETHIISFFNKCVSLEGEGH